MASSIIALCTLTACAAPASEAPAQAPIPTATSAPQEQPRETGLIAPAQPFDGDCSAFVTDAELTELVGGVSVTTVEQPTLRWINLEQAGGLHCESASTERYGLAGLDVAILPQEAVAIEGSTDCYFNDHDYLTQCDIDVLANGWRMSGRLWAGPWVSETARDSLVDLFVERATAAATTRLPIPAQGAWSLPVDCAAVVAGAGFDSVPLLGADAVGEQTGGSGRYRPPAEFALWGTQPPPTCVVVGQGASINFTATGGARWMEPTIAEVADLMSVSGVDSAYVMTTDAGVTVVHVFDGPNWLHFQVAYVDDAQGVAAALIESLDATAPR